jgi:hypothetical protein
MSIRDIKSDDGFVISPIKQRRMMAMVPRNMLRIERKRAR